jgi:hypothetical protein
MIVSSTLAALGHESAFTFFDAWSIARVAD